MRWATGLRTACYLAGRDSGCLVVLVAVLGCSGRTEPAGDPAAPAIFVRHVIALESGLCVAAPDPSVFWGSGLLDATLRNRYDASLLVGSTLGADHEAPSQADAVAIDVATVAVWTEGGELIEEREQVTTGFVEPRRNANPGWGVVGVRLLTSDAVQAIVDQGLPATVIADVRVAGNRLGGSRVETPVYRFPIELCAGCLIHFPAEADSPHTPGYDCRSDYPSYSAPCRLGQDEFSIAPGAPPPFRRAKRRDPIGSTPAPGVL